MLTLVLTILKRRIIFAGTTIPIEIKIYFDSANNERSLIWGDSNTSWGLGFRVLGLGFGVLGSDLPPYTNRPYTTIPTQDCWS